MWALNFRRRVALSEKYNMWRGLIFFGLPFTRVKGSQATSLVRIESDATEAI